MARILFVTWDGGGNVAPAMVIAAELRRRGDEVRFLGHESQRAAIEGAGFGFAAFSTKRPWTAMDHSNTAHSVIGFLRMVTDRSLGADLLAEAKASQADLVVVDCLLFGALNAAARAGLKHVAFMHSLYEAFDKSVAGALPGLVARIAGLSPRKLWGSADAILAATVRELDQPPTGSGIALTYTGPALPVTSGETGNAPADSGDHLVLVSLSTTYIANQEGDLQRILDALAGAPYRVVVTTGPSIEPAHLKAPANAEVRRFVPHAELMPRASAVVGHGGHATTMLALAHGLPLLIMPMMPQFDQVFVGRAVERAGAGVTLGRSAPAADIRAAVDRLMTDGPHRAAARRLGADIRSRNGAAAAADLLQQLAAPARRDAA